MKSGAFTVTGGAAGLAELKAAIAKEVNPETDPARGTIPTILSGAMKAVLANVTFVVVVSLGAVFVFQGDVSTGSLRVATGLDNDTTAMRIDPEVADIPAPSWSASINGSNRLSSISEWLADAGDNQTQFEVALSAVLRPARAALTVAQVAGSLENIVQAMMPASDAVMVISQGDSQFWVRELVDADDADAVAAAVVAGGLAAKLIVRIDRAETATVPKGAFGI